MQNVVPVSAGQQAGPKTALAIKAYAKINLSLIVLGPRPDGFHDLHSVMAMISLHDDLHLQISDQPGIRLLCTGQTSPVGPENLVWRAAELLAQYAGRSPALALRLHKRIPPGAGLGGGSSDAAACLLALNKLWRLGLTREHLRQLAAQLGSDVPFFLYGPVALCTGRGEIVESLPSRCRKTVLLIKPGFSVSTALVYQKYHFDPRQSENLLARVQQFLDQSDLDGLVSQGINNLTEPALQVSEPLGKLRDAIQALDLAPVALSGSGATLFMTADSTVQAQVWADIIKRYVPAELEIVSFVNSSETFLEVHHADF